MILITYEQGDISLLHAITAAKSMIQHRAAGTECTIEQRSDHTLVTVRMAVDANGVVSEDIRATPRNRSRVDNATISPVPTSK